MAELGFGRFLLEEAASCKNGSRKVKYFSLVASGGAFLRPPPRKYLRLRDLNAYFTFSCLPKAPAAPYIQPWLRKAVHP
jgi:hypothetical protein